MSLNRAKASRPLRRIGRSLICRPVRHHSLAEIVPKAPAVPATTRGLRHGLIGAFAAPAAVGTFSVYRQHAVTSDAFTNRSVSFFKHLNSLPEVRAEATSRQAQINNGEVWG